MTNGLVRVYFWFNGSKCFTILDNICLLSFFKLSGFQLLESFAHLFNILGGS